MRKTTIYLDDADDELLQRAAARRGSSRTDLIRLAIRQLLSADAEETRRPRPLGRSGHSDTSQRVDQILAEGFDRAGRSAAPPCLPIAGTGSVYPISLYPEAVRKLVLLPVFKTGVACAAGRAGSIPVRLRDALG